MTIKYAIIPPLGQSPVQTSEARVKAISEEWLKLSTITKKTENTSQYLMAWIKNPTKKGEFALEMDIDSLVSVQKGFNTGYLLQLYGQLTKSQEHVNINASIKAAEGGQLPISSLLPVGLVLYTAQEMIKLGYNIEL